MSRNKHRSRLRWGFRLTVLVLVAAFIALLGGTSAMAVDRWTDISDQTWINVYGVTAAEAATVASGYPDGSFKPSLAVNRGQFAKMAVDGLALGTANPATPTFSDVPKTNTFFIWIEGGVDAGVISGFPDGTYHPTSNVLRQQANSILGKYLSQKELTLRGHIAGAQDNYPSLSAWYTAEGAAILAQFADASSVSAAHAQYTAYLIARDVVQGSPSGGSLYLRPGSSLTRAQAVAMILRVKSVTFLTALPTVTLLNPNSGPAAGGNSVVITGTNFTAVQNVKFGTSNATSFVVNSATQITAVAPAGTAGTVVDVTVTTPAGTSSALGTANDYAYGFPTVTGLNPAAGPAAGANTVIITGTNFIGVTAVKFGAVNATSFVVNSATQITAVAPAGTAGTTVDVTVTTAAGTSVTGVASKYSYGLPTVTLLNPAAGPAAGQNTVIITGTGFTGLSGAPAVKFGANNAVSYIVNSPTQITAVAPAGIAGTTVDVTVTNPVGTSSTSTMASKYSYGAPTVTLLTPASGPAIGGTSVIITGTGFTGVSGASAVKFGANNATSYVVNSATQITAVAPAGTAGTTVDVTVTNPVGTSPITGNGNDYAYGAPTVTALAPNAQATAAAGTPVTITGTGFVPGATVAFGGVAATNVVVVSPTSITCQSPAGTLGTTVEVTVTTPVGTSPTAGAANDYAYGSPTVTALNPTGGPIGGGTPVAITGTGFVPGATVAFGGVAATSVVVVSPTTITCISPAHAVGTVDVAVTTSAGTSANTALDNYVYGIAKFAVTMTGGTTPLSAVAKTAGTAFSVRVTAQDAIGNTITTYTGTVRLTSNAFAGNVDAVIVAGGMVDDVSITPTVAGAGDRFIGATDVPFGGSTTTANASGNFTVNAGTATNLDFGVEPTNTVAGVSISPAVTVRIEDTYGNLVDDDTTQVTLALGTNPGGDGVLDGTVMQTAVNGVATFNDLNIDEADTGYTLAATSNPALIGDTSAAFNITVAAAAKLTFLQQPQNNPNTPDVLAPAITVRIEDAFGNLVDDDTTVVTMAIANNPSGGTLTGTLSQTAVNGVATFNNLSIDLTGIGYTLGASSNPVLTPATSVAFNIVD